MMAPPIRPPTTPAATPRCALAGVAASEPAIVATATKAANVFFMLRALLEVAPSADAGFKGDSHAALELAISLKSAQRSTESKRFAWSPEKTVFSRHKTPMSRKTEGFPGHWARFNEGERD